MHRSQDYLPLKDGAMCVEEGGTEESYSSETDSSTESYSDGSEVANWEKCVSEDGSLFYVEYIPKELCSKSGESKIEFMRNSLLRLGKKSSRRKPVAKSNEKPEAKNDFMFAKISTNEECSKSLELVITAADRFRFGRRSTAVESILGFNVVPFVDQPECLMVEGFVHDMPALFQQGKHIPIGKGDWFKTLDDIEIRTSNIDELLFQFIEPTKVCLKFQGPFKTDCTEENGLDGVGGASEIKKIENYEKFAQTFEKVHSVAENSSNSGEFNAMTFGFLILPPECYQDDDHKNSLYHYPEDPRTNFLYKARGSFLTLNAVLSEELKTKPSASKLAFENVDYFVFYRSMNGFLVLFSFPCTMVTLSDGNLRADELLTYIKLMYPNMNLDSFKNKDFCQFMYYFCEVQRVRLLSKKSHKRSVCSLEDVLTESRYLPLPKEAQLRIFDALSEMEAMDYRNWNDEPLHTHREFFIYGSVLYYDNFMLASQMPLDMRHYIEVFMRCRGVFYFISKHNTKELYLWEEINLPDSSGKYFLAICGRGHLILSVILKIFCTPDMDTECPKIVPSLFYIEEIQETLDHLIQCGIESLAMFWSISNKRPEILEYASLLSDEQLDAAKESKKIESFVKQKLATTSNTASSSKETTSCISTYSQRSINYDDDTQLCSSLGGSSVHSLTPSEDDSSKKRLITQTTNADDSDSGSDWEHFVDENLLHCGTDAQLQPQVTESLWKEISNVVPVKVSAGWKNHIFYYIYVDSTNSSVFCPLKSSKETFPFVQEMYEAFHMIHNVLQKTKNYKRDSARANMAGRDIVAVKEHGITIRICDINKSSSSDSSKTTSFIAVGRLFLTPPKEVYICHRPEISQNMVEMAFRLSFFSIG